MNEDIMVSIVCATYNHVNYIRQCLDSFLMQKTNFAYEILIHDDASTDGTTDIVKEYEKEYPNIVKPIYQVENQYSKGISPTMVYNLPRAKGKYIAMCEGDDYWTDPLKLQKQVDLLERNQKVGMVYTAYNTVDVYGLPCVYKPSLFHMKCSVSGDIFLNLLWRNFPQTLTVLFRKNLLELNLDDPICIDYSLFLLFAMQSECRYLEDVTGSYRINPDGLIQSGAFKKYDIDKLRLFYYMEYICSKKYRREFVDDLRIHKFFLCRLCNFRCLYKYKSYFKRIIYNAPFLIIPIFLFVVINSFKLSRN